ncbi:MAG: hypothetical protein R3C59_23380 [Planctomycetaceae bacterium]
MNVTRQPLHCLKLVAFCCLLAMASSASADLIFLDEFTTDPASNGWVITIAGPAATGSTITTNGDQAVITEGGGAQEATFSLTRTIDTTGYSDITVNLRAFQSNVNFEATDYLGIQIDTGSGYTDLLRDHRAWTGIDDSSSGSGQSGTTTATATGDISLPVAAAQNSALGVRIIAQMNTADETYFLESFTLSGSSTATVPEPNSLTLACLMTVALGGFKLRRRLRVDSAP